MSHVPSSPLRTAGLRVTPQRQAILQALDASDRPLKVEEILSRMGTHTSGVPTVYRNLHEFSEHGWVEPIIGEDQVIRFIRCRSAEHHHHIQCEKCGRMVEVEGCELSKALKALSDRSGFRITRHQLQLFGLCPACKP